MLGTLSMPVYEIFRITGWISTVSLTFTLCWTWLIKIDTNKKNNAFSQLNLSNWDY